jgi:hypothetical protein
MTDFTIASGEIRSTTQSVSGDGGKIAVQTDAYIINAAGKGLEIFPSGPKKWDIRIDGGIQSTVGFGFHLISAPGIAVSNLSVGIDGTIFSDGSEAVFTSAPLNINNAGAIVASNAAAISIIGLSNAAFKIVNTSTGLIQGNGAGAAINIGPASGGAKTIENGGSIVGDTIVTSGTLTLKNSGVMESLLSNASKNTITNTLKMDNVTVGGSDNALSNSGYIVDFTGGNGNDKISNSGIIDDLAFGAGTNTLSNTKTGNIDSVVASDNVAVLSNNTLSNAGEIRIVNFSTTTGVNVITNSGLIKENVIGGNGSDTLINTKTIVGVVNLNDGANKLTNSGLISDDVYGGSGVDNFVNKGEITGSIELGAGNDLFTGGKFHEYVKDGNGQDLIKLGAGDDTFFAFGATDFASDIIDGGAGTRDFYDAANFASGSRINLDTADHVDLLSLTILAKNSAAVGSGIDAVTNFEDVRTGAGNDIIFGNAASNDIQGGSGDDTLYGLGGNDIILGGANADKIFGGAGADRLSGGSGADQFYYTALTDSGNSATTRDEIRDFAAGTDDIILQGIDANSLVAGDQSFTFLAGANADFTGVAGQLRFLHLIKTGFSGFTLVQGDVNGDQIADFSIELQGHVALTAGDFIL